MFPRAIPSSQFIYICSQLLCCTTLCRAWVLEIQLLLLTPSSRKFLELSLIPTADEHLYLFPSFHTVKCVPFITNKCKYLLAMCAAIIIVVLVNAVSEAMAYEILLMASPSGSKTVLKMFFAELNTKSENK